MNRSNHQHNLINDLIAHKIFFCNTFSCFYIISKGNKWNINNGIWIHYNLWLRSITWLVKVLLTICANSNSKSIIFFFKFDFNINTYNFILLNVEKIQILSGYFFSYLINTTSLFSKNDLKKNNLSQNFNNLTLNSKLFASKL